MSSRWICLLIWTGIIAFLPIMIRLYIGQDWPLDRWPVALEYLGWFFFFGIFVVMGHAVDIESGTVEGRGAHNGQP